LDLQHFDNKDVAERGRAYLAEPMFEQFAEHVVEDSNSGVDMPSTEQVISSETTGSELADVDSGESIRKSV